MVCTEETHVPVQPPSTSPKSPRSGDCINCQSVPPCINQVLDIKKTDIGLMTDQSIEAENLLKTPLRVLQQEKSCSKPLPEDETTISTAVDFIGFISFIRYS